MPNTMDTVPKRVRNQARKRENSKALIYKKGRSDYGELTYGQMYEKISQLGCALMDLGISRGDHIAIISDNRWEWMIIDQAVMGLGAVDVPRGSDSTAEEISYILNHSDSTVVFAENDKQAEKILSEKKKLKQITTLILIQTDGREYGEKKWKILTLADLLARGEVLLKENPGQFDEEVDRGGANDTSTLIYTSGTTGQPKGVELAQEGFTFQLERIYSHIPIKPDEMMISVLPVWHTFERTVEYIVLNGGGSIAYSKPIGSIMLADMARLKPQWFVSVPRIWEGVRSAIYKKINKEGGLKKKIFGACVTVAETHALFRNIFYGRRPCYTPENRYLDIALSAIPYALLTPFKALADLLVFKKIRDTLGGKFVAGVSGGGALPPAVDNFFDAAGIVLLEGYGLTETAPVLAVRKHCHPVAASIGPFLEDVQYKIIGAEGEILPPGEKGVLWVKSPQIMKGYYKAPEKTAEVMNDGWFNTGDIAMISYNGVCKILGRAKETIVLMGGENIEPVPIEERITESEYIDYAVVVGQDQKFLGALIVPNQEMLTQLAEEKGISYMDPSDLTAHAAINEHFQKIIQEAVSTKNGFRNFEKIFRFALLPEEFSIGRELTKSLKLRRNVITDLYRGQIEKLFL